MTAIPLLTGASDISEIRSTLNTVINEVNVQATQDPTISSGSGAPGTIPTKVGDIYVDTNAAKVYAATGIASSGDWTALN